MRHADIQSSQDSNPGSARFDDGDGRSVPSRPCPAVSRKSRPPASAMLGVARCFRNGHGVRRLRRSACPRPSSRCQPPRWCQWIFPTLPCSISSPRRSPGGPPMKCCHASALATCWTRDLCDLASCAGRSANPVFRSRYSASACCCRGGCCTNAGKPRGRCPARGPLAASRRRHLQHAVYHGNYGFLLDVFDRLAGSTIPLNVEYRIIDRPARAKE